MMNDNIVQRTWRIPNDKGHELIARESKRNCKKRIIKG